MLNSPPRSGDPLRRPRRTILAIVCTVTALALSTGCSEGSDSGQDADVASVSRPQEEDKQKEASSRAESGGGAPQLRLDTTETEKLDMFQPYLSCLKEHGVPVFKNVGRGTSKSEADRDPSKYWYTSADMADYPDAEKSCGAKRPLTPPELDPKRNPRYLEQFRDQIECLNREGLKVDGLPDGTGWTPRGDSGLSAAEESRIEDKCLMEAFGGRD